MSWLYNLSIKIKIRLAAMIMAVIIIVVGIVGSLALRRTVPNMDTMYKDRLVPAIQMYNITKYLNQIRSLSINHIKASDTLVMMAFERSIDSLNREIDRQVTAYAATYLVPEEEEALPKLRQALAAFRGTLQSKLSLSRAGNTAEAERVHLYDGTRAVNNILRVVDDIVAVQERVGKEIYNDTERTANKWQTVIAVAIVIGLIMGTAASWVLIVGILRPIRRLQRAAEQMASGNVDVRVKVTSEDEVGRLGTLFNTMATNIRALLAEVMQKTRDAQAAAALAERSSAQAQKQQQYLAENVEVLLAEMNQFAAGNLTAQVEIPSLKSEAGQDGVEDGVEQNTDDLDATKGNRETMMRLFNGFNETVRSMANVVGAVVHSVDATVTATMQISSASEEVSAALSEQTLQTTQVAAAVEQMSQTIAENTRQAALAAQEAEEAKNDALQGGEVVRRTIQAMNSVAEVVLQAATAIETLGKSSEQIGDVIQTIEEIADQTNLLALNAAIEAARAGEQGRGFAVVADEVRKLAERTTTATKEIAATIKHIQQGTDRAVHDIRAGKSLVDEGQTSAVLAVDSLERIIRHTAQVSESVAHLASASEEQARTSEEIAERMGHIRAVAEESFHSVADVAASAERLRRLADELRTLVHRFSLGAMYQHAQSDGDNYYRSVAQVSSPALLERGRGGLLQRRS
jgi:methyl-accepting chemotaxis protein